ncbi:MAG: tRNA nucleotidyltransferase [Bacteroidetes bacterium 4572_128]|nr:MAG: tRNA nucleotidyltransferase [Bacteroidetes bacterium 4572_128]
MKKYLTHKIFEIIRELEDKPSFVIGGFVRDLIIGRNSKDIDIVVLGSGIELAKKVAKNIGKNTKISIFKNFGTAMLRYGNYEIEFVGARKESYKRNSRKPMVENGTLEEDQKRRDFTINAMAISLNKNNFGKLIDPFNGINDLKEKILKTPLEPEKTFSDDPLRMMRGIRFASQLNYKIEKNTYNAISEQKNRIKIVSKERITEELNKILMSKKPSIAFKILYNTGLLKIIFPEFHRLKGKKIINNVGHKDVFFHTLEVIDNVAKKTSNLWLLWAALMHDIGKPITKKFQNNIWTFHGHEVVGEHMVKQIFKNLKLPTNEKMKYVKKLVSLHLRPIILSKDIVSDSAVRRLLFEAGNDIDDLMTLCEADITSKNETLVKKYLQNFKIVRKKLKEIEEKDKVRNFQPPISGEIIMETFNIQASRNVGIIKNSIKEAILDGLIKNNYEEAHEFMLKKAAEIGLNV